MGRHASLFAQIGNAPDMGGFEPSLPVGNHRVAMVKYGAKVSKKDGSVRVEGEFIILDTDNEKVRPGALHSWMWAIQGAGFVGQYARDRSKKFLQTVQSCLNNDAATDAFGDALDEMFYQQSETGEIADLYGLALDVEVHQVFEADGVTPKKGKNGQVVFNANWTAIEQGEEEIQQVRQILANDLKVRLPSKSAASSAPNTAPPSPKAAGPDTAAVPAGTTGAKLGGLSKLLGKKS